MTSNPTNPDLLPATSKKWKLLLVMVGIFLCGAIVGGAISQSIVREQMHSMLRNPGDLPNRIVPRVVHSLGLSSEQTAQVEPRIREYFGQMEALRAQVYPQQVAEFDSMCSAVSEKLDEGQQKKWMALTTEIKQRYLPLAPVGPPQIGFLFSTFDANLDESLDESEVPPRMWHHLRNADADDDGVVSKSEFQAARNQSQQ